MLGVAFHHSVIPASDNHPDGCLAQVEQIRQQHLGSGYSDIAYNRCVCIHGGRFEGRGWGRVSGANGTQWSNLNYWAVVALYDGRTDPLTDEMKAAFIAEAQSAPNTPNLDIAPHSEFFATGCPWDPIRDWIAAGIPLEDDVTPEELTKQLQAQTDTILKAVGARPDTGKNNSPEEKQIRELPFFQRLRRNVREVVKSSEA